MNTERATSPSAIASNAICTWSRSNRWETSSSSWRRPPWYNRPEEIAQARANVDAAAADEQNARAQFARLNALSDSSSGRAVSRQDMDSAKAALDTAEARLAVNQKALALELAGPRKEDVAQGEAQLRADQAQLALLQQQFKDADLLAPLDAVVRSRIVEPGEISSPQKSAFTLAIIDPKWVRAYVAEPDLGSVHEGMRAAVTVDAFRGRSFPAWVGFISPGRGIHAQVRGDHRIALELGVRNTRVRPRSRR